MASSESPSGPGDLRGHLGSRPDFSSSAFANVVASAASGSQRTQDDVVAELNAAWDREHAARLRPRETPSRRARARARSASPPRGSAAKAKADDKRLQRKEPAVRPLTKKTTTAATQVQNEPISPSTRTAPPDDPVRIPYQDAHRSARQYQWYGWEVQPDELLRFAQSLCDGDVLAVPKYQQSSVAQNIVSRELDLRHLRTVLCARLGGETEAPFVVVVLAFCGYDARGLRTDRGTRPTNAQVERVNAWLGCGPQWFLEHEL